MQTFQQMQISNALSKYNLIKVVNSREVWEVQEGATCFCAKKLSKLG